MGIVKGLLQFEEEKKLMGDVHGTPSEKKSYVRRLTIQLKEEDTETSMMERKGGFSALYLLSLSLKFPLFLVG